MSVGQLYALGIGLGLLVGWAVGYGIGLRQPTRAEDWRSVYSACIGGTGSEATGHRTECIAAADRVLACAGQKEGKP